MRYSLQRGTVEVKEVVSADQILATENRENREYEGTD